MKNKKSNLVFYCMFFLISIFGEIYSFLKCDEYTIIIVSAIMIIATYLFLDKIGIEYNKKYKIITKELNNKYEEFKKMEKAIYTATKNSKNEILEEKIDELTSVCKDIIICQKEVGKGIVKHTKENNNELFSKMQNTNNIDNIINTNTTINSIDKSTQKIYEGINGSNLNMISKINELINLLEVNSIKMHYDKAEESNLVYTVPDNDQPEDVNIINQPEEISYTNNFSDFEVSEEKSEEVNEFTDVSDYLNTFEDSSLLEEDNIEDITISEDINFEDMLLDEQNSIEDFVSMDSNTDSTEFNVNEMFTQDEDEDVEAENYSSETNLELPLDNIGELFMQEELPDIQQEEAIVEDIIPLMEEQVEEFDISDLLSQLDYGDNDSTIQESSNEDFNIEDLLNEVNEHVMEEDLFVPPVEEIKIEPVVIEKPEIKPVSGNENKQLSPDEIAALFAQAQTPAPAKEEKKTPIKVNPADANKQLSADEIAALFASMGQ